MRSVLALVGALVGSAFLTPGWQLPAARAATGAPHLIVAPNVRVDAEGSTPFGEPMVAASPTDPKYLVGAAMFFSASGWDTRIFVSHDRGYGWNTLTPPALIPIGHGGTGDVEVGFGPGGTAYYTILGPNTSMPPGKQYGLWFFRSTDGGAAWPNIFIPGGFDHEQIAIDNSRSRFRGRIYLSVLTGGDVAVLHSADGGRSFSKAVRVGKGFSAPPVVMSDGTLLVPIIGAKGKPARGKRPDVRLIEYALSHDGGSTFSAPRTLAAPWNGSDFQQRVAKGETDFDADSEVAQFAIDRTHGAYRDRIYAVWGDLRYHTSRVMLSYSSDHARTWSKPVAIGNTGPAWAAQYQPAIAVAPNGTLGISWFDTRNAGPHGYDEYFTASRDGGRSFLPPVRVSTVSSYSNTAENRAFTPAGSDPYRKGKNISTTGIYIFFTSPRGRYVAGGDYMGLAADAQDAFHPFWIDARSGRNQVYTASVTLGYSNPAPQLHVADLSEKVTLDFEPGTWNDAANVLSLPVRLRNTSNEPLYGPFTITVVAVALPDQPKSAITFIVNADNGKTGIGATFHYVRKLGGLTALPPGGLTQPLVWKLKLPRNTNQPTIGVHVEGFAGK